MFAPTPQADYGSSGGPDRSRRSTFAMLYDLILALVFIAMIVAPALITMRPDRDEKDPL